MRNYPLSDTVNVRHIRLLTLCSFFTCSRIRLLSLRKFLLWKRYFTIVIATSTFIIRITNSCCCCWFNPWLMSSWARWTRGNWQRLPGASRDLLQRICWKIVWDVSVGCIRWIGVVWCGGLHYKLGTVDLVLGPACSCNDLRRDGVYNAVWLDWFLFLLGG